MQHDEADLKGLILAGRYPLREAVSHEGGVAVFETEHQGLPALVYLIKDGTPEAEWRQQQWSAARKLEYPHLVRILDGGYSEVQDHTVLYCVTEKPDDTLAGVLQDRPLTPEETTNILKDIVPALRHLHAGGWLHGKVSAQGVVAVGDQVKLTVDTMAPGNTAGGFTAEVRDLGRLVAAMLHADPSWTDVPSPLREIGKGLSDGAWGLVDAERMLKGRAEEPAPVEAPAADGALPDSRWKIAAAIATGAVVLTIPFLFRPGPVERARTEAPAVVPNQPITTTSPPAGRQRVQQPAPAAQGAPKSAGDWAVVTAIYRDHGAASKRAEALRAKWTRSEIEVYPPSGQGSRYLVLVARGLTRKDADRLRSQARASGLPRDTYVTRLR